MSTKAEDLKAMGEEADEIMGAVCWLEGWIDEYEHDVGEEKKMVEVIKGHLANLQKHFNRFVMKV